jgi:sulfite reductase alpha subunit-like flavoprotein
MDWYRPRELVELRFAGEKQPGDLPRPTEPLFSVAYSSESCTSNEVARVHAAVLEEYSRKWPFESKIVSSKLLTSDEALKPVYCVQLDVSGLSSWEYMPGDAFGVVPENDPEVVQFALKRLRLEPQAILKLAVIGKATRDSRTRVLSLLMFVRFSG